MKVLAINGSPRKDGNTATLIKQVLFEIEKEKIETELIQLSGNIIRGCSACYQCKARKDNKCAISDDIVNDCIQKMMSADGIILGSPTYFCNVSTEMKALIDRAGVVARVNNIFKNKVGAAVVAVRRAGAVNTFNSINHLFFATQMIVPGSVYWNLGMGGPVGSVQEDEEGIKTMKVLGQNTAWLLHKINSHHQ